MKLSLSGWSFHFLNIYRVKWYVSFGCNYILCFLTEEHLISISLIDIKYDKRRSGFSLNLLLFVIFCPEYCHKSGSYRCKGSSFSTLVTDEIILFQKIFLPSPNFLQQWQMRVEAEPRWALVKIPHFCFDILFANIFSNRSQSCKITLKTANDVS